MALKTTSAFLSAVFALTVPAGMALAQTAEAPADSAAETTPPAAAETMPATAAGAATAEAPAAAPAPAAPPTEETAQPGQTYIKEIYDDWTLRCIKTEDGFDPCELYQLLRDGEGTQVAEVTFMPVRGQVAAVASVVTPLETDLQHGLGIQIDAGQARTLPFAVCAQIGCVSRIGLKAEEVVLFKRGNAATISVLPFGADPKNRVNLTMSLKGFTSGYDALDALITANIDAMENAKAAEQPKQ